ncbi:hypothetical protein [Pelomonas sp. BJYL3]|uniref:hypothetical protein n=1 Tax=Pelomonas sp. BJYL3 TaxID=2976697 RepID=UPI0022B58CF8|nr:hypothetical protein [Pelomonas sp. BJYL3]
MTWWRRLWAGDAPNATAPAADAAVSAAKPPLLAARALSLEVRSSGMCCSLGHRLAPASAAIRANMDRFVQSEFTAHSGQAVRVARMPSNDQWGRGRLALWIAMAVRDCLLADAERRPASQAAPALQRCAMGILVGEASRTDVADWVDQPDEPLDELVGQALAHLGYSPSDLHPASRVMALGAAGLPQALDWAESLLSTPARPGQAPGPETVLLVGVDSLLNSRLINHYLSQQRLILEGHSDGFLPGEAAAALLLQKARPQSPGLTILAAGQDWEPAAWAPGILPEGAPGAVPNRGQGLSRAIGRTLAAVQPAPAAWDYRCSDQNGESWRAREATNACTRALQGQAFPALLTLTDKIGDVGAANGVALLAYLDSLAAQGHAAASGHGFIHLANEQHVRAAVAVRPRPDSRSRSTAPNATGR